MEIRILRQLQNCCNKIGDHRSHRIGSREIVAGTNRRHLRLTRSDFFRQEEQEVVVFGAFVTVIEEGHRGTVGAAGQSHRLTASHHQRVALVAGVGVEAARHLFHDELRSDRRLSAGVHCEACLGGRRTDRHRIDPAIFGVGRRTDLVRIV